MSVSQKTEKVERAEKVEKSERPDAERESRSAGPMRITVNLGPRGATALDQAVKWTGDSKTDTINRALQVYAYLQQVFQEGGTLYTRPAGSEELERLHFV